MTDRNEPCPCGSGKKFKKCCMNPAPKPPHKATPMSAPEGSSRKAAAVSSVFFAKRKTQAPPHPDHPPSPPGL